MKFYIFVNVVLLIILTDNIRGAEIIAKKPSKCALVRCAYPKCINGETPIDVPNECCPVCPTIDCSLVLCPGCALNEMPVDSDDSCCPTCVPYDCIIP